MFLAPNCFASVITARTTTSFYITQLIFLVLSLIPNKDYSPCRTNYIESHFFTGLTYFNFSENLLKNSSFLFENGRLIANNFLPTKSHFGAMNYSPLLLKFINLFSINLPWKPALKNFVVFKLKFWRNSLQRFEVL